MLVSLATSPALPDWPNEDFAATAPDIAVLLDGAGTQGAESGCSHGVAWFTRHLGAHLLSNASDGNVTLRECLGEAIGEVRTLHAKTCDVDHPGSPSATVVIVRRLGDDLEYLVLADSVLVFDFAHGDPRVVTDDREAQIGRAYRSEMDALPNGTPEHKEAVRRYIETLRSFRNTDGGFWVASSVAAAGDHALTGSVPCEAVRAVALLSDGASRLVDRFQLAGWVEALKLLEEDGPADLLGRVRRAEDSDPYGERWPRGKTHDDATVVYWALGPS